MTPFENCSTVLIPLDKGQSAIVSASQAHLVEGITWHARWNPKSATYYACGTLRDARRRSGYRIVAMHRLLSGILEEPSVAIHHRDKNGLNNATDNMQAMTHFEHNRLHGQSNGNPVAPHIKAGYISKFRRVSQEEVDEYKASWPAGIEFGFCWCGCGNMTEIAPKTERTAQKKQKWIEGQPKPLFFPHRFKRIRKPSTAKKPWLGLICACGGRKSGQATVCKSCQLSNRRPPVDPTVYYDNDRPYRRVPCTKMQYTLVSADKYSIAASLLLAANFDPSTGGHYVTTRYKGKHDKLHRILANAPDGVQIDHANRNGLDNRDWNLRPADGSQQAANQRRRSDNKSGFIGVWYREERKSWCGMVSFRGKHHLTRHCKTAQEAAIERDEIALRLHGIFAVLNFPKR